MTDRMARGYVTNIQRFTVHDGPGIRTGVFLKGCPLRCRWCSNPENIRPYPEVGVYPDRCIGIDRCGFCLSACPEKKTGVLITENNLVTAINRDGCARCFSCAGACPANALIVWGKLYTVREIIEEVLEDLPFYAKSGGGVTLSGGDPLTQWEFSLEILKECRKHGIHTCLETEQHVSPQILKTVYPYVDMVITDIKHMDSQKHREYTGAGNELILRNIAETAKTGMPLIIRIPVIPGHNDNPENIEATARFITGTLETRVRQVQLLPYRPLGTEKYHSLGLPYGMENFRLPEREVWEKSILSLAGQLKKYGIPAAAGSSIPAG